MNRKEEKKMDGSVNLKRLEQNGLYLEEREESPCALVLHASFLGCLLRTRRVAVHWLSGGPLRKSSKTNDQWEVKLLKCL